MKYPVRSIAAHPLGTPERFAADLSNDRQLGRWYAADQEWKATYVAKLRVWLRLHPEDEHAQDLLRVWVGGFAPCWKPCESEVEAWRKSRDLGNTEKT